MHMHGFWQKNFEKNKNLFVKFGTYMHGFGQFWAKKLVKNFDFCGKILHVYAWSLGNPKVAKVSKSPFLPSHISAHKRGGELEIFLKGF